MATQVKSPQISDFVENSSMARQAVMNGNFDVWQRGTSGTPLDASVVFVADRWADRVGRDGGTLPTLSRFRTALSVGQVPQSFYCSVLTTNGAGSGFGVNAIHDYEQKIEHGTRFLAGAGKKVTVSFYAASTIVGKKLGISMTQNYGTSGTPTADETLTGTQFTLTGTFTKYTYTFTTNTLVGKTFGTANDDNLRIRFWYMWGSTIGATHGLTGSESYVGAGDVYITQVQICSGDEALPFQPKSYGQELRDCQRYAFYLQVNSSNPTGLFGPANSTTNAYPIIQLPVPLRYYVSLVVTPSDWRLNDFLGSLPDITNITTNNAVPLSGTTRVILDCTTSGLTVGRFYSLQADATATRTIGFEGEL